MRNLLQLLIRYYALLLFLLLEMVSFWLFTHWNSYQQQAVLSSANMVVSGLYTAGNSIGSYFGLQQENDRLQAENTALYNRIALLENQLQERDSNYLGAGMHLHYIAAKVVNSSTARATNYLTLNKGERDDVKDGMGVRNGDGIVGIVCSVSNKFSVVIPVINTASQISCRLSNDYVCSLSWDGLNYQYADLQDVARHVQVAEGDSVFTSGLTTAFPSGILVGIVAQTDLQPSDANHRIRVKLAADFRSLSCVEIIDNRDAAEQQALEQPFMHRP